MRQLEMSPFGAIPQIVTVFLDKEIIVDLDKIKIEMPADDMKVDPATLLTDGKLHQTWIWDKEVNLKEIAYAKLIRVRGLDWLIAPRLYVRTMMGKFTMFYAADKPLIDEFQKLADVTAV